MQYELAKQLKDAGFPPIDHDTDMDTGGFCVRCEWSHTYNFDKKENAHFYY